MSNHPLLALATLTDRAECRRSSIGLGRTHMSKLSALTCSLVALMQAIFSAADGLGWICAADRTGMLILRRPILSQLLQNCRCRHLGVHVLGTVIR